MPYNLKWMEFQAARAARHVNDSSLQRRIGVMEPSAELLECSTGQSRTTIASIHLSIEPRRRAPPGHEDMVIYTTMRQCTSIQHCHLIISHHTRTSETRSEGLKARRTELHGVATGRFYFKDQRSQICPQRTRTKLSYSHARDKRQYISI